MLSSPTKSAVSFVLFFFMLLTAEASCFLRHQLYRMQSSSLEDIQTFLAGEGWEREGVNSATENRSGFGFKKSVFTKYSGGKILVYSAAGYGNIIQLELLEDCFQTISTSEFGQVNRKLLVEQDRVIKEYRDANQIVQLVEQAGSDETNPEILIFNEDLRSQVKGVERLFSATAASSWEDTRTSTSTADGGATNEVYDVVETQPNPPGGMAGWNKYLSDNLKYPTQARRMDIEGTVIVVFVINTDGSIQDVELLRGIGGGCDEEAIKIVKNAPKWTPGMQRGKPVRTRMRLPIKFKLYGDDPRVDSTRVGLIPIPLPAYLDEQDQTKESTEVYFDVLDTPPSPIGGLEAWQRYLSLNLTYPTSARMYWQAGHCVRVHAWQTLLLLKKPMLQVHAQLLASKGLPADL